ncbi:unnamed protein product [Phytophthora fragariaefolia]|uniref:Unnamed protein product n=1 Tax=Phytophthora fragariaefolia TaxID=1490495 RepID=A0A9W6Y9H3_9STRA|nr:unnamed protein product [Phytophthora fragariaefolia]
MKSSPNRAKQVLEVVHSDVCGPMQTSTFRGKRYFVTFTDDKSHFCVVYLLRNKSEVADKFVEFVAMAETQTGKRVKTLRSDNGGEWRVHFWCDGQVLQGSRHRAEVHATVHAPAERSGGTDESDAGGVGSLYAGARRVVQVVLGRSGDDCYVPSQSVSYPRDQPRQVAAPSVDGKEAAASQPQGVRLSCICACAEGEAIQVRLEVSTLPFCRVFGARESVSV